jgi:dTDP-4-amino-4,6-dideoxygalactose transaminase
MADMEALMPIAQKHQLVVIEDAAQAIGAEHHGRRAGSIGHYGCFSFFPSKNLGAAGDAGMVVTQDAARAGKLACLRMHGSQAKYYHQVIGGNFRLDALQAAVVRAKLRYLDAWTAARQRNAERYHRLFTEAGLPLAGSGEYRARAGDASVLFLPDVATDRHIFNQYVIRTPRRDALRAALQARDIGTEIYYPVPLHLQECFAYLGGRPGTLPESEKAARETLALPIYPELSEAQARQVVQSITEFMSAS